MWTNWAGDQRCQPAVVERPSTVSEAVGAVERAVTAGRCVRVAGSGHSFTGAVLTDGSLVALDRMGALLDADPAAGLVRVQAGITIRAFNDALADRGLALANLGDIDAQAIAGAVATATHGTGATLRNLSAQVRALQLVTAAGEVLEIDGGAAAGGVPRRGRPRSGGAFPLTPGTSVGLLSLRQSKPTLVPG